MIQNSKTCIDCGKPISHEEEVCKECNILFNEALKKSCTEGTKFSLKEHRAKIKPWNSERKQEEI